MLTRCPVVVGRDGELAATRAALWRAAAGGGGVLVVLGEAGVGKSRFVREAEALARGRGMRVLRGRAIDGDSRIPYRPLAEALQAAFRSGGMPPDASLEAFRPALGKLSPQWASPDAARETSFLLVFEGLVRLLSAASAAHGALVVLEDLHWADADTVSAVEYLAEQLPGTRCLCVVTVRSDEPSMAGRRLVRLADRSSAAGVRLGRLGRTETAEMARRCVENLPVDADVVAAVVERSEGIPLLVEELLTTHANAAGLPDSYAAIVQGRLNVLSASERRVIDAVAAVGPDADVDVLGAVTGLDPVAVVDALRAAREANLLVDDPEAVFRLAFRHALVADAVLAQLLPMQRRELYLRAAEAIELVLPGLPGAWCERVADLRERGDDPHSAFVLLIEAGRRAIKRGALLTAEQTLERARSLARGDRWRTAGVDRLLVRVLALLGNGARLRELARGALSFMERMPELLGTPERTGAIHLEYARGLTAVGDWSMAREHAAQAERQAVEASDDLLACRARGVLARVAYQLGESGPAAEQAAMVLTEAERLDLPEVAGEARRILARGALGRGDIAAARGLLEHARRIAERRDLILDRIDSLLDLAVIDEATSGTLDHVVAAADLAVSTEAPLPQVRVDLQTASILLARFDLAAAAVAIERATAACRRHEFPLLPQAVAAGAHLAALRGDRAAVRSAMSELRATPDAGEPADLGASVAEVVLAMVAADLAGVAAGLAKVTATDPCSPYAWCVGLRVLADVAAGDVVQSRISRAPGTAADSLVGLAEAVAAGRAGDRAGAMARFAEANSTLMPFPWRRHVALRLVAPAAIADRWGAPDAWLAEADSFFEAAGHGALAASCRGLLRRAGVVLPRRGRGGSVVPESLRHFGVTSREMDVLGLVKEGLSNQEIAERLVLSVRTVETHIGSAMRKTGARNRAGLVGLLGERRA